MPLAVSHRRRVTDKLRRTGTGCFQVKALGALYGLQPRNCGRKGITLFKTDKAGFPDQNSSGKVRVVVYSCLLTQDCNWIDQCNPYHVINLYRRTPDCDSTVMLSCTTHTPMFYR